MAGPSTSTAIDLTDDFSEISLSDIFIPSSPASPPSASTHFPLATANTSTPVASPIRPPLSGSFRMDESVNPWKVNREFHF